MKTIICPHCGKRITVNGLGRKRLAITVNNVCEALRTYQGNKNAMHLAASDLCCSQGFIYKVLKENNMRWEPKMKCVTML